MKDDTQHQSSLTGVQPEWGKADAEHYGYASEEERKNKRGLEDWELVDSIPQSQKPVPYWFYAIVVVVLLVAIGLSFPFWGTRPGHAKHWLDWGFLIALVYIGVAGTFVYFMVHMYGAQNSGKSKSGGEDNETGEEDLHP